MNKGNVNKDDRKKVKVENEARTPGISKMISEGGLGSENYYNVKKVEEESKNEDD